MDRDHYSFLAHQGITVWHPGSLQAVHDMVARVGLKPGSRVLDIGSGRASVLIDLAATWNVNGVGVDKNPYAHELALEEAERAGVIAALDLNLGEFGELPLSEDAFRLCICLGSSHAIGDYAATLKRLSELALPGGYLLIGEMYWRAEPPAEYLEFMGMKHGDLFTHDGNIAAAEALGLELIEALEATADEWKRYEDRYAANIEEHAAKHPGELANAMLERIRPWRRAYLEWGHETLGFGKYLLRVGAN